MQLVGYFAVPVAFWFCVYAAVVMFYGGWKRDRRFVVSGSRALHAATAFTVIAAFALYYSLFTHDFSIDYVARYSDRELPLFYLISAFWAGHPGSLFLWGVELALMVSLLTWLHRNDWDRGAIPYTLGTAAICLAFFLGVSGFLSNPFLQYADGFAPLDGQGMNPLLQDPGMFFHPPTLFTGYAAWTIPFAYAVGALIAKELDDRWIRSTRLWAMFAWTTLTIGVALGAWWSYKELGWGGYWAWDPVENASIMPWLIGTAYIHSIMVQERRKMFKIWNFSLVTLAFATCIFGTFLTRSDVLSSLHTFGKTDATVWFLYALIALTFISMALIAWRYPLLRSENSLRSLASKEASFALNNVVLLLMLAVVFVGTMFPVITGLTMGTKISVDVVFFNSVIAPLALIILVGMGVGPLLAWQATSLGGLKRNLFWPAIMAVVTAVGLLIAGHRPWMSLLSIVLCVLTLVCILQEFWRGIWAARLSGRGVLESVLWLFSRNQRRYGGYLTHLGVVLLFIGLTGSELHMREQEFMLKYGESATMEPYSFRRGDIRERVMRNFTLDEADLEVRRGGDLVGVFTPSQSRYSNRKDQVFSEVALYYTLAEDVYVIYGGESADGAAYFKIILRPLVSWLWFGSIVMVLGAIIAMVPLSPRGYDKIWWKTRSEP